MKIGFIGLGNVGGKLANSLLRNKFDLTVRDVEKNLTNDFKSKGAKVSKSAKELAEQTDLIITCLPSPEICAEVMESENGLINGLSENKIWFLLYLASAFSCILYTPNRKALKELIAAWPNVEDRIKGRSLSVSYTHLTLPTKA